MCCTGMVPHIPDVIQVPKTVLGYDASYTTPTDQLPIIKLIQVSFALEMRTSIGVTDHTVKEVIDVKASYLLS